MRKDGYLVVEEVRPGYKLEVGVGAEGIDRGDQMRRKRFTVSVGR